MYIYISQVKVNFRCVKKLFTNVLLNFYNSFCLIEISRKYSTIYMMRCKIAYEMKYARLGSTNFLENCCL